MTFGDFLKFMQGSGIEAAIGFIVSFAVEWIPDWSYMEWRIKRIILIGFSLGIPMLFATIGVLTGYQSAGWEDTFWPALRAGGIFFLASQATQMVSTNKAQPLKDAINQVTGK